jgi:hypothetical protein
MRANHTSLVTIGLVGLTLAAVAAAAGCSNDLPVASQLERTRVIGARVTVAADPGRAEALPGEPVNVEWIVAGPRPPQSLDWAFAICVAGQAACVDAPGLAGSGSGAPVVVPVQTPDASTLTGGFLPLVFGEVCADGTLGLDPSGAMPTCTGPNASGTDTRFLVPVRLDGGTPNRQPNLANDVLELDGAAWDPASATVAAAGDSCDASTGLPVVTATPPGGTEVKHPIRLVSDADDRETFTPPDATAPTLEELQLSNFATAGKFESSYAAIYPTDTRADADVTMKWVPPGSADVAAGGEVVILTIVVRDLRGGLDFTSRALCLTAP